MSHIELFFLSCYVPTGSMYCMMMAPPSHWIIITLVVVFIFSRYWFKSIIPSGTRSMYDMCTKCYNCSKVTTIAYVSNYGKISV